VHSLRLFGLHGLQKCLLVFAQLIDENGEDLEDPAVIDRHATDSGLDLATLHAASTDGVAARALAEAEAVGRKHGVQGTPAWLFSKQLIMGLRPAAEFERLADYALQLL
jgi:predicted DsbA family dithiol-disulfide isomerase